MGRIDLFDAMRLSDFPELCSQIHPSRNGDTDVLSLSAGSHKKVWWQCVVAKDHVWQTEVRLRTKKGYGCPFCAGTKPSSTRNLQLIYPEIAKSWHPTKNGEITPSDVLPSSTKKCWWICENGHEYEHSVNQRTTRVIKCPFCSGYRIDSDNNFLAINPVSAAEWDYAKNGNVKPEQLAPTTHKKYWFRCQLNHSYKQSPAAKSRGHGCPKCTSSSSIAELRIFSELRSIFPKTINRHKVKRVEVDVYIPELRIGIEYDGSYWHKDKIAKDQRKRAILKIYGITLIRVRQSPLKALHNNDLVLYRNKFSKKCMNEVINKIRRVTNLEMIGGGFSNYLSQRDFVNGNLFDETKTHTLIPPLEESLLAARPEVEKTWDYNANSPLRPEHFRPGSNKEAWWLCSNGHKYKQPIHRKGKASVGCPLCNKERLKRGIPGRRFGTVRDKRQLRLF